MPILRNLDQYIAIKRGFCQQEWSVDFIVYQYTRGIKRSRPSAHIKKAKYRIQAFINPLQDFTIHFRDPRRKAVYLCKDLSERSRKDINVNRTTNINIFANFKIIRRRAAALRARIPAERLTMAAIVLHSLEYAYRAVVLGVVRLIHYATRQPKTLPEAPDPILWSAIEGGGRQARVIRSHPKGCFSAGSRYPNNLSRPLMS